MASDFGDNQDSYFDQYGSDEDEEDESPKTKKRPLGSTKKGAARKKPHIKLEYEREHETEHSKQRDTVSDW